jgi:hypothetical protein
VDAGLQRDRAQFGADDGGLRAATAAGGDGADQHVGVGEQRAQPRQRGLERLGHQPILPDTGHPAALDL